MDPARILFQSRQPSVVTRSAYDSTVPQSLPFEMPNGDVKVLGYEREIVFCRTEPGENQPADLVEKTDGKGRGWAAWSGFGNTTYGPGHRQPGAFADDGTVFFATGGDVVRGVRDGNEVASFPAGGKVATPVMLTRGGDLAFALEDGRVRIVAPDGRERLTAAVPDRVDERPLFVTPTDDGGVVVCTRARLGAPSWQGRVVRLGANGNFLWARSFEFVPEIPPVASPDGKTIYVSGVKGGLVALETTGGATRWQQDLEGAHPYTTTGPVFDDAGNVSVLAHDGTIYRLSPEGVSVQDPIATGSPYSEVNGHGPMLAVDAAGDVCATTTWGKFVVYDGGGKPKLEVAGDQLFFHPGDYVHGISLSRDRTRAFVLGSSTLACIALSPPLATLLAKAADSGPSPSVEKGDDFVRINGIKVPVRKPTEFGYVIYRPLPRSS